MMAFVLAVFLYNDSAAQTTPCSDPGGGARTFSLAAASATTQHYYPAVLPSGALSPAQDRATVGYLGSTSSMNMVYPMRRAVIHPQLGNGATGSVVLKLEILTMNAPDAYLKIYEGASANGSPLYHITAANASGHVGQNIVIAGPVTVEFESATPATGNFDIDIRFMTGDQVITSSLGNPAAVWTDFIQPDSYTLIDNYRTDITFAGTPMSVGYFDKDRNFVSSSLLTSDRVFCLDHGRSATVIGGSGASGIYPGRMNYSRILRPDMNRDGVVDATDALITARLVWIMKNGPTALTHADLKGMEGDVWTTVLYPNASYGGSHDAARSAIPSLPTPIEPTFSITATSSNTTTVGAGLDITVSFDIAGSHPRRLKLDLPAGVTISDLNGATYNSGFLVFGAGPSVATFKATSIASLASEISVSYEETGFWNVSNVMVYRPCNIGSSDYQDFIGVSEGLRSFPYRQLAVEWTGVATPVSLSGLTATQKDLKALLDWKTVAEHNNRGFGIERSGNAADWRSIGFVESRSLNGNSSEELGYDFIDASPLAGKNYYRLRQVDLDGTASLSKVVSLDLSGKGSVKIYPNPVVNEINIEGVTEGTVVRVYDLVGQEVSRKTLDTDRSLLNINVTELSAGTYFVHIENVGRHLSSIHKIVKK